MDTANTLLSAGNSTYPREPLRLQGILDEFKQFDVTAIVGTEFPDVKLVDWMEASNSDILLRDLAITSLVIQAENEQQDSSTNCLHTDFPQSLNVASSSSAPRTDSRTISRNSLLSASASSRANPRHRSCTFTLCINMQVVKLVLMKTSTLSAPTRTAN